MTDNKKIDWHKTAIECEGHGQEVAEWLGKKTDTSVANYDYSEFTRVACSVLSRSIRLTDRDDPIQNASSDWPMRHGYYIMSYAEWKYESFEPVFFDLSPLLPNESDADFSDRIQRIRASLGGGYQLLHQVRHHADLPRREASIASPANTKASLPDTEEVATTSWSNTPRHLDDSVSDDELDLHDLALRMRSRSQNDSMKPQALVEEWSYDKATGFKTLKMRDVYGDEHRPMTVYLGNDGSGVVSAMGMEQENSDFDNWCEGVQSYGRSTKPILHDAAERESEEKERVFMNAVALGDTEEILKTAQENRQPMGHHDGMPLYLNNESVGWKQIGTNTSFDPYHIPENNPCSGMASQIRPAREAILSHLEAHWGTTSPLKEIPVCSREIKAHWEAKECIACGCDHDPMITQCSFR